MKAHTVSALKAMCQLEVVLKIANLARATYFYHQARENDPDPDAELKAAMQSIFTEVRGRYGYRRMLARLQADGWKVGKKRVRTLMWQLGLVCQVRRRKPYRSYAGEVGKIAPNLLNREFTATAPNQKWVTDITEFAIGDRKVYLSPVMDLFDRQIIAWSVGNSPNLQLALTALQGALSTLPHGATPIIHSDQGMQYQHLSWQKLVAQASATQSMSRKGNCLDNAVIESFFGHLKEEMFHHRRHTDIDTFTTTLNEYITWYNTERISTRLKGMSPVEYRTHALAA